MLRANPSCARAQVEPAIQSKVVGSLSHELRPAECASACLFVAHKKAIAHAFVQGWAVIRQMKSSECLWHCGPLGPINRSQTSFSRDPSVSWIDGRRCGIELGELLILG